MSTFKQSLVTALSMFGSAVFAQGAGFNTLSPTQKDLSDYKGEYRPLLVFAPDAEDPDFKDQLAELREASTGLMERDIIVHMDTEPETYGKLRTALAVDSFEVVLVGKDGSVKLRQKTPVAARLLFDRIDEMPMRQRERSN